MCDPGGEAEIDRLLDVVYQVALIATLWLTGLALGATIAPRELGAALRRTPVLARVAILDVVIVPALAWLTLRAAGVEGDVEIGLLLVAIASAGPFGMKASQIARGDLPLAIALVVLLEAANAVGVPIWVALLMPEGVDVPLRPVIATLVWLIVAPLVVGGLANLKTPNLAATWAPRLTRLSDVGIALVVALIVTRNAGRLLDAFGTGAPLVALFVAAASAALGWALGGPSRGGRRSASLVTTIRAGGPALAIGSVAFAGRPGVPIGIVVYGAIALVLSLALAVRWGRVGTERLRRTAKIGGGDDDP